MPGHVHPTPAPHHTTPHHNHTRLHHTLPHHVTSHNTTPKRFTQHHITPYHGLPNNTTPPHIAPHYTLHRSIVPHLSSSKICFPFDSVTNFAKTSSFLIFKYTGSLYLKTRHTEGSVARYNAKLIQKIVQHSLNCSHNNLQLLSLPAIK